MTDEFINGIKHLTPDQYSAQYGEIEQIFCETEQELAKCSEKEKHEILAGLAEQARGGGVFCRLHVLSFCMKVSLDAVYAEQFLDEVLGADYDMVGEYNKLNYFWQFGTVVFQHPDLESARVVVQSARLYTRLFWDFAAAYKLGQKCYIAKEERNRDLVFVFTSQVLGMDHAPTKTLLDRCYVLQKQMGKKVFIINTAMQVPEKGQAPFYGIAKGGYVQKLSDVNELQYCEETFRFYQCENKMPDLEIMANLIRQTIEQKPLFLLDIGGSDICADLCGLFVPKITVSTVFSKIATSCGEYQIVDKELTETDKKVLEVLGVHPLNVKRAMFTFSFKEQTHHYERAELGICQDKFALLIAGWRLDEEVDETFLQMLETVCAADQRILVAFMGGFDTYEARVSPYPHLAENSRNLGKQPDALAVTECCDVYVNPKRNGGGSSMAEALYKGLPAVTLQMGDAYTAAGEAFGVPDFAAMKERILRYCGDEVYYKEMSEKAKSRAVLLTDSGASFGKVIEDLERQIL